MIKIKNTDKRKCWSGKVCKRPSSNNNILEDTTDSNIFRLIQSSNANFAKNDLLSFSQSQCQDSPKKQHRNDQIYSSQAKSFQNNEDGIQGWFKRMDIRKKNASLRTQNFHEHQSPNKKCERDNPSQNNSSLRNRRNLRSACGRKFLYSEWQAIGQKNSFKQSLHNDLIHDSFITLKNFKPIFPYSTQTEIHKDIKSRISIKTSLKKYIDFNTQIVLGEPEKKRENKSAGNLRGNSTKIDQIHPDDMKNRMKGSAIRKTNIIGNTNSDNKQEKLQGKWTKPKKNSKCKVNRVYQFNNSYIRKGMTQIISLIESETSLSNHDV